MEISEDRKRETQTIEGALARAEAAEAMLGHQQAELERARALLDTERERFRELFDLGREGYLVTDAAGVIRESNRGGSALLNLPVDYLVGKPLAVFIDPADRREFRLHTYRARNADGEEEWTSRVVPRDVSPFRVRMTASPMYDAHGVVTGLRWVLRDVSARHAAQVSEREPAAIVRAALDALSVHVAVLDADGRIVTVNRAWHDAEKPGGLFNERSPTGANYVDLCDAAAEAGEPAAEVVRDAVLQVLHGRVTRAEVVYEAPLRPGNSLGPEDGDSAWYALRVTSSPAPEPITAVVTHEEVTAERRAYARERALLAERAARAAAEAANRAKTEFLTTLSHELRTPLNAIAGYAQLLEMGLRGPVTVQQSEDLRRILRSEQHLLGLINELLNFSRLERGEVKVDRSAIGVTGWAKGVLELIEPQAMAKSLHLEFDCDDDDLMALGDGDKLRQVLLNLLSNALKFTPAGGTVRVTCSGDESRVYVRVQDSGIGIPDAKLETIFDPFVQLHRNPGVPSDGIGLGLAISRSLARAMNGDLTAQSEPGRGSIFELSVPRAFAPVAVS